MKTDKIKSIQAVVAVYDHGSLTVAAQELGCSKAYLSQQIKKLEAYYRVQLFHRTTRQLKATAIAEGFIAQCRQALTQIEQAEIQLQDTQAGLRGIIRITSVGGIFGERYVAPAIISFMAKHPDVHITLDFSSKHHNLIQENYDMAIRMGPLEDSSLVARQLCRYRPTLVASPCYLKRYGEPDSPEALASHRLIAGSLNIWHFKQEKQAVEVPVHSQLHCANGHIMLAACEAGQGIARLPSQYVDKAIAQGRLCALLKPWHQEYSPCHIVFPPGRFRSQRVKALVEALEAHFKGV